MSEFDPQELLSFVRSTYEEEAQDATGTRSLFGKKDRPKLSEVTAAPKANPPTLPDWIANKQYVTENVDALKYEPALMLGALVRKYDDGTFQDYSVTYNVRKPDAKPEVSTVETPTNFFEQTFDQKAGFNASFIIGGVSLQTEEMVKVTYTETNYANLREYDVERLEMIRGQIKEELPSIPGAKKGDWAIIRGVVVLDCTYSKHQKTEIDAQVQASWVSLDGSFYKQEGTTNNFRLISIDLEPLFLLG